MRRNRRNVSKSKNVRLSMKLRKKMQRDEKKRIKEQKMDFEQKEIKREVDINDMNQDLSFLIPQKMESGSVIRPDNVLMESRIIPSVNESVSIIGTTGSGKTNTLCWMLNNPRMYKDFFDKVYLFSISGKCDDMFDTHLKEVDDQDVITTNFDEKLKEILKKQKAFVEENDFCLSSKILIIFEDITSSKKLLKSKEFTTVMTMGRHLNITSWSCSHKYKSLPPVARLNSNHLYIFPVSGEECQHIYEDHCPNGLNKKGMMKLIHTAFQDDEKHVKPFLYINNKCPMRDKFRKCFDNIIRY